MARIAAWDLRTVTGIPEGFDPGDNPAALSAPSQADIASSVATTLYTFWRNQTVRNVIDATLTRAGLASHLPGNEESLRTLKNLLDTIWIHDELHGKQIAAIKQSLRAAA